MNAEHLIALLREKKMMLATAESCTGGMLAAAITDISGASDVFDRGFVTYSNASKAESLGVEPRIIATHGAVSEQTARAMADGTLLQSRADITIAITGVAGPNGGTIEKPVGLVYFCISSKKQQPCIHGEIFAGPLRQHIRHAATQRAVSLLIMYLS